MSSDVPEGSGPISRRPRAGDGGAPSGALAIVLAIVAVVAGFLILRSINDDDDGDAGETPGNTAGADGTATSNTEGVISTDPIVTSTTTTQPPLVLDPAVTVIVANASNVDGSAAQMSRALGLEGYTMGDPTNKADTSPQLDASVVYFDPAVPNSDAVAGSVARSLGGANVSAVATPAPTESGEMGGAGVLVMLGVDKAGKTLDELTGATTADTTPTGETSPPVAGDTTPP
jgi:LytR cell envelope-related transcriptional attenuator